jgi:hypothetical protein
MSLVKRRRFPVAIALLWYTGAAYRFLRKSTEGDERLSSPIHYNR